MFTRAYLSSLIYIFMDWSTILLLFPFIIASFWLLLWCLRPRVPPFDFRHKHIVITGGSSGIGLECARQCLREGARLVTLIARDVSRLEAAQDQLCKEVGDTERDRVAIVSLDTAADQKLIDEALQPVISGSGPIDALILCAGIFFSRTFLETSRADFDSTLDINVKGVANLIRALLPSMLADNSLDKAAGIEPSRRICIISSQSGQIGIKSYSAYSCSKFALRGLAESLQMELRPHGVYVVLTHPPDTQTPGLTVEQSEMSPEIKNITGDYAWPVDVISGGVLHQMRTGQFFGYFGLNGYMLAGLTAGASPSHDTSTLHLLAHVCLAGIFRIVALFFLRDCDKIIAKATPILNSNEQSAKED